MDDNSIDSVYEYFWKPIVEPDGVMDFEQVKKELFDFYHAIHNVSIVYEHITCGHVSKINAPARYVISFYDDCVSDLIKEARKEWIEES
jgi:hypothetical protein